VIASRIRIDRRSGFTLLELLLATLIAALLLGALYMSLNITLQQTQTTRDAIETEDLTRGVFNKLSLDLSGTLGPLPPKSGGNSAGSGGQVTGGTPDPAAGMTPDPNAAPTGGATPMGTTPDPAATDPNAADPTMPGATDNATAVAADTNFQGGVIGEEKKLVLYTGRVPEAFGHFGSGGNQERCDQRQIIYWYEPGRGLCRQERPWVTADGVRNSLEPDRDALDASVIAEEVVDVFFEYFDGTGTSSGSWDGTAMGPDGVTVTGPPRAIRITLVLEIPTGKGEPLRKQVSQVIPVRSAPGPYTPPLLEAPTDGATDTAPADQTAGSMGGMSGTGGVTPAGGGASPTGGTRPAGGSTPPVGGSTSRPSGGSTPSPNVSLPSTPTAPPGVSLPSSGGSRPSGGSTGGRTGGGGR
jgi:prepilin-type N-terminal cleavage/methylation domain-containing protein